MRSTDISRSVRRNRGELMIQRSLPWSKETFSLASIFGWTTIRNGWSCSKTYFGSMRHTTRRDGKVTFSGGICEGRLSLV